MFGRYALSPRTRVLTRDGERIDVQQQPLELLLLEHADQVVTREMIRRRIWPDAVVEYDQSTNYAVRQVRVALGEEAWRLQTVPRRGYRLVGPIVSARGDAPRRRASGVRPHGVAAVAAMMILMFGAGLLAAHTDAGMFIYDHLVHPDRCPYIQAWLRIR